MMDASVKHIQMMDASVKHRDKNVPKKLKRKKVFDLEKKKKKLEIIIEEKNGFTPSKIVILPRNKAQVSYLNTLNQLYPITFSIGPAGTGKTLLATKFAIQRLLERKIKKIIITRPTVSTGEDIGFLPGSLVEKLTPWCIPILDVFKETYPVSVLERMIKQEIVEIAPLGMMRGRTFKNCIVILDEAQNVTREQMKMFLTRIGENSNLIITGDPGQHDRNFELNGMKDFVERVKRLGSSRIAVCEFTKGDVERHPVIEEVLGLYSLEK